MAIKLKKQAASTVQTPASTHVQFFVDSDGQPKVKDDSDTVVELSQSNFVTLNEQLSAPPTLADKVRLYAKDVAGVSEFFVLDDQGQEVQITNNGAINVGGSTDTTSVNITTSVSVGVDTSTYCAAPFTTVTLPDATGVNLGKRLSVTFGNPGGRIVLTNPFTGGSGTNILVNELGQFILTSGELASIDPGTYEFRSIDISALAPGLVAWTVHRLAGSYGRKSTDVRYCLEGDFPIGFVQTSIGTTGRWVITGTGTNPPTPTLDAVGSYTLGSLVLAPYASAPGMYRVMTPVGGEDWRWEVIESTALDSPVSETEYRVSLGEIYGSRKFYTNVGGSPPNNGANYLLEQQPCQVWPIDGTYLDGDGSGSHAHLSDICLLGKTNLVDTTLGPFSLELSAPTSPTAIIGERFAIKIALTGGVDSSVTILIVGTATIEDPDNGSVGSSVILTTFLGKYIEWQLDNTGVWRVVGKHIGFSQGGGG